MNRIIFLLYCASLLVSGEATATVWYALPKTGQAVAYAPGDDGEAQAGIVWPKARFADNDDGTITDNLTGLTWLKDGACLGPQTWDGSFDRIAQLNSTPSSLGCRDYVGTYRDWRLPNVNELVSLFHAGTETASWLNGQGFTNVISYYYWSSTTARGIWTLAWYLHFGNGFKSARDKEYRSFTLPVRGLPRDTPSGGPPAMVWQTGQNTLHHEGDDGYLNLGAGFPANRFTADGECVRDNMTGLMWVRNTDSTPTTWEGALDYAQNLDLCGYTDWRLPNRRELETLLHYGQSDPLGWLAGQGFNYLVEGFFWSSTTTHYDPDKKWIVYLAHSGVPSTFGYVRKDELNLAIAVRDGSQSIRFAVMADTRSPEPCPDPDNNPKACYNRDVLPKVLASMYSLSPTPEFLAVGGDFVFGRDSRPRVSAQFGEWKKLVVEGWAQPGRIIPVWGGHERNKADWGGSYVSVWSAWQENFGEIPFFDPDGNGWSNCGSMPDSGGTVFFCDYLDAKKNPFEWIRFFALNNDVLNANCDLTLDPIDVDDGDASGFELVGTWSKVTSSASAWPKPASGTKDYRTAPAGDGTRQAKWSFSIPRHGTYEVLAWWPYNGLTSSAVYEIYVDGTLHSTITKDQRQNGRMWNRLGIFDLAAGSVLRLVLSNRADGTVIADGMKITACMNHALGEAQRQWVKDVMEQYPYAIGQSGNYGGDPRHVVFLHHEPAFGTSRPHDAIITGHQIDEVEKKKDRDAFIREIATDPTMTNSSIMIFSGHEHNYTRRLINSSLTPSYLTADDFSKMFYEVKTGRAGANPNWEPQTDLRNVVVERKVLHTFAIVDLHRRYASVNVYALYKGTCSNTNAICWEQGDCSADKSATCNESSSAARVQLVDSFLYSVDLFRDSDHDGVPDREEGALATDSESIARITTTKDAGQVKASTNAGKLRNVRTLPERHGSVTCPAAQIVGKEFPYGVVAVDITDLPQNSDTAYLSLTFPRDLALPGSSTLPSQVAYVKCNSRTGEWKTFTPCGSASASDCITVDSARTITVRLRDGGAGDSDTIDGRITDDGGIAVLPRAVTSLVTFVPIASTYATTTDTSGCPAGCKAKYSFDARLTNKSTKSLSFLLAKVRTLSGGNFVLNADAGPGRSGSILTLGLKDDYADGFLGPRSMENGNLVEEYVDVRFEICLKTISTFTFYVDVLGVAQ
jgi:hypothetical protein